MKADREIPERVIKRPFASVPFISEYEEPLTNSISVQQISRSAPCNKEASMRNISFASVPFFLEYEEPLTNSISVQQISRSAPCNISFATVPFISEYEEPLTNSISVYICNSIYISLYILILVS